MGGTLAQAGEVFDDRFLFPSETGALIERSLLEMTPRELLCALQWQEDEAIRLDRETEPHLAVAVAVNQGRAHHYSPAEVAAATEVMARYRDAAIAAIRLLELIRVAIPEWPDDTMSCEGAQLLTPYPGAAQASSD
jgi:hypothetical protein